MNETGLFRSQALAFKRDRPLGEAIGIASPALPLLTALASAAALALIAFACWGEYTRKAHVSGYLAPSMGLIKVYAPQSGTIVEKQVVEGQSVKAGDTLYVLSTESGSKETPQVQTAALEQLRQRRDSLTAELNQRAELDHIEYQALLDREQGLRRELQQLDGEIATQQARVDGSASSAERFRQLAGKHFVSPVQIQQKQDEWLDNQGKLQALQRNRLTAQRDLQATQTDIAGARLKFQNQRAAIERNISELNQKITESESRRTIVISAPEDGTATAILAERGQVANPANPLLSILPAGAALRAQLMVPSSAIGFVETDQTVLIRYQAFPYQRFGSYSGRIVEIAKTLISPKDADLPIELQEPAYRVTVALDRQAVSAYKQEMPLQSGMRLDADICLDTRRLIDWVFDPLYSLTGRV
ncbi:HlyD family efflux transporter periplasmic adaptor subunit [Methylomonas sp. UP202]|uniref:HlyD family secretion protein n=1 Tax=Methylomonas sp. UP202 TaxID=3040943 RepID=UPI002478D7DB|nr:HlyD family efflux transporter periplasmic adaptor subunit [Methylomonas sp. UP202]WGS87751.1 HlyD family efflux transporter periplasmic adaptor subunit [Methylomonas sp. UP202]